MLPDISQSSLLVIDVQQKLLPAMWQEHQQPLLKHTRNLLEAFRHFEGQILYSEQYPRGLGPTVQELAEHLRPQERIEKVTFSVLDAPAFAQSNHTLRKDVVLTGMETHVCVLLTARDLLARNHRVWIPFDAVASRLVPYRDNALELLRNEGAHIINAESLLFCQLGAAGGETFKKFSRLIR